MPDWTITTAAPADLADAARRHDRLVGVHYSFEQRNERGHTVLVAKLPDGQSIGHIAAGPRDPHLPVHHNMSAGRGAIRHPGSWHKLYALAVDADHQHTGVGVALLAALIDQLPAEVIGLYGNVDAATPAAGWYRRRGFHLAPEIDLRDYLHDTGELAEHLFYSPNDPAFGPNDVYFRAWLDHLRACQGRAQTADEEHGVAQHETDRRERLLRQRKLPNGKALQYGSGWRYYARAAATAGDACTHAQLGPRTLWVAGHDPNYRAVCDTCRLPHASTLQGTPTDDETLCDGCGTHGTVTTAGFGRVDTTIVMASLCRACQNSHHFTIPTGDSAESPAAGAH